MMKQSFDKILYMGSPKSTLNKAIRNFVILFILIAVTTLLFYFDRDGLVDNANPDEPVGLIGVIYFTIVTITTLGYGDIVPVTDHARLFDAIFVTGVRVLTYFIIVSTALELTFPKILEGYMIQKLIKQVKNHIIICGYGRIGQELMDLLVKKGADIKQIVVVDTDDEKTTLAAEKGVAALKGNAETEKTLTIADTVNAKTVYICTDQDHTNLMICLTARSINKNANIVAIANENENIKLFKNGGASKVVSLPSLLGRELLKVAESENESSLLLES